MSDSDGSPQRDDRHHRRSRSRSPISPGCAGETLAQREERWLAEAALPVGPPARPPQAAPADPGLPVRSPRRPRRPPPPLCPRLLPPHPRRGPRIHRELRLRPRQAAPRPQPTTTLPPARHRRGGRAQRGP